MIKGFIRSEVLEHTFCYISDHQRFYVKYTFYRKTQLFYQKKFYFIFKGGHLRSPLGLKINIFLDTNCVIFSMAF